MVFHLFGDFITSFSHWEIFTNFSTNYETRGRLSLFTCCVFRPAMGCALHPKAGGNAQHLLFSHSAKAKPKTKKHTKIIIFHKINAQNSPEYLQLAHNLIFTLKQFPINGRLPSLFRCPLFRSWLYLRNHLPEFSTNKALWVPRSNCLLLLMLLFGMTHMNKRNNEERER